LDSGILRRVFYFEGYMALMETLNLFWEKVGINQAMFAEAGLELVPVNYFNSGFTQASLFDCVKESRAFLKYYEPTPNDFAIGHSAGGLIVRYFEEVLGVKFAKTILVECPNGGTNRLIEQVTGLNRDWPYVKDMRRGSKFMKLLPPENAIGKGYIEFKGKASRGKPARLMSALGYGFTEIPGATQMVFPDIGHVELVIEAEPVKSAIALLKA
jgi:hypothetical protein